MVEDVLAIAASTPLESRQRSNAKKADKRRTWGGAFQTKPGGSSLVETAGGSRGTAMPGPGKQTLTGQLSPAPALGATASTPVQRKADAAPPDPAKQRRMMELYLTGNQTHVWNIVGEHARSVAFPDPHARLTWTHHTSRRSCASC